MLGRVLVAGIALLVLGYVGGAAYTLYLVFRQYRSGQAY